MRGLFVVEGSILRINVPNEGEALRVDTNIIRIKRHEMLNKAVRSGLHFAMLGFAPSHTHFAGGNSCFGPPRSVTWWFWRRVTLGKENLRENRQEAEKSMFQPNIRPFKLSYESMLA